MLDLLLIILQMRVHNHFFSFKKHYSIRMMRSLARKTRLQFTGNVNANAITLGDVDNDGLNELIVGNIDGDLGIFKQETYPRFFADHLGTITVLCVGKLLSSPPPPPSSPPPSSPPPSSAMQASSMQSSNWLVVVNAEGTCHLFTHTQFQTSSTPPTSESHQPALGTQKPIPLDPMLSLPVPVNICRMLVADVDGDGQNEIIMGRTDRILHAYNLRTRPIPSVDPPVSNSAALPAQLSEPSPTTMPNEYELVEKARWELPGQIGSMAFIETSGKSGVLVVAQPGGHFITIQCAELNLSTTVSPSTALPSTARFSSNSMSHPPSSLHSPPLQNTSTKTVLDSGSLLEVATELVGPVCVMGRASLATCTMDGTIRVHACEDIIPQQQQQQDTPSSSRTFSRSSSFMRNHSSYITPMISSRDLEVQHQVFALCLLPRHDTVPHSSDPGSITSQHDDVKLVACAWNGTTYWMSPSSLTPCLFQFHDRVCAFLAGLYAPLPESKKNEPCFIYVTFQDEIMVYWDLEREAVFDETVDLVELVLKRDSSRVSEAIHLDATRPENREHVLHWIRTQLQQNPSSRR